MKLKFVQIALALELSCLDFMDNFGSCLFEDTIAAIRALDTFLNQFTGIDSLLTIDTSIKSHMTLLLF